MLLKVPQAAKAERFAEALRELGVSVPNDPSVTEVVVPGLVGLVLLGDRVRPGWGAVLGAGWVLAVAGLGLLTRSSAEAP